MIYTVTLNPSLDYVVSMDGFSMGKVNRTNKEQLYPGGKGINVSLVLKNLGLKSTALGFIAGFTGEEIERSLTQRGCITDFISMEEGISRINVKLCTNIESEINGQGPHINEKSIKKFLEKLSCLDNGDILVLAGSIPNTMKSTTYEEILKGLPAKKIKIVVDATGDLLKNVLKYRPFLIKPNHHEMEEIFQTRISTKEELILYGKDLQNKGAENVLISMAGDGAILVAGDGNVYMSEAPKGQLIHSVGAGDSMVAGFLAGYLYNENYAKALCMGVAAGSASAFSVELATKEEVDVRLKEISYCIK